MPAKRTDIERILHKDDLVRDFEEILDDNPDSIVIGYIDQEGIIHSLWYGSMTSALGLLSIVDKNIHNALED